MQQRNVVKEEITLTENLKMLAGAYEEISIVKIQSIRNSVLNTREFLSKLSEVFYEVRSSYKKEIEALLKKGKVKENPKGNPTLAKNGKTISIFISSNSKLYGQIIPKVFNMFIDYISMNTTDIVIIGRYGKNLFDERKIVKPYTYFRIPDNNISIEDLKPIIDRIIPYERVLVFYGKFVNLVDQSATSLSISGEEPFTQAKNTDETIRFLFEPDIEKLLLFFETQVLSSFFKQTFDESELARYASRIQAMEAASENINVRMRNLKIEDRRIKRAVDNKKQQETIASISLWNR